VARRPGRSGQVLAVEPARRHRPGRTGPAREIRWRIERDYRGLKTGLGLDHFEVPSWLGWHRHVTLVTAAHLFITTLRLDPKAAALDSYESVPRHF
jgi:SRSO17 transposase